MNSAASGPSLRRLKPLLFAMLTGLSGMAAHAGSCNFTTAGATACAIPAGVTSITVVVTGGGGGGGGSGGAPGGGGAVASSTAIANVAFGGQTLTVNVGSGGAAGGTGGGGGGDDTRVVFGSLVDIVAGGGGGGGFGGGGGGGGIGGGVGSGINGISITGGFCGDGGAGGVGGFGGFGVNSGMPGGNGLAFGGVGGGGVGLPHLGGGGGAGFGGGGGGAEGSGGKGAGGGAGGSYVSFAMGGAGTSITSTFNGGLSDAKGGDGSVMISWIDPVVAMPPAPPPIPPAPPPIPPLPGLSPVPGIGSQPTVLDLSASQGPTMTKCLLSTVRTLLGADAQYLGESANGVGKFSVGGSTVSFYALQADTTAGAPGIHMGNSNVLGVSTSCGNFNVAPAIANLTEFGALIKGMGLQANIHAEGLLTLTAGSTVYTFRPDYMSTPGGKPGAPSLTAGADGQYRFTDSAGNVQMMHPAFIGTDGLGGEVTTALSKSGWIAIQTDGTAMFTTLGGQQFTLTPDLTLNPAPAAHASDLWWQDAPNHYQVRSNLLTMAQGFTVR